MSEEEKKVIETLKKGYGLTKAETETLSNLIDKQQKEIEELRKENFDTVYIQAIADFKSKIRKILQIEGNADIETYLKTIVAENNRLEDIEDDRDCNYISKDKIREKIKEIEENEKGFEYSDRDVIKILEELLEE